MVGSAAGGIGKGGVNMAYIRKTVDRWDIETNWGVRLGDRVQRVHPSGGSATSERVPGKLFLPGSAGLP